MRVRQINLFADKKHFRELNDRWQYAAKQIMQKQLPLFEDIKKCLWANGSTNPHTLTQEMPTECKKKGCDGIFVKEEPSCFVPKDEKVIE